MTDLLNSALAYARRGWYVFPCRERVGNTYTNKNGEIITPREKTPYVGGGLDSATRDEGIINAWWQKYPSAMIGINCGKSGLFVVDIDKKNVNGLDTFMSWKIQDGGGLHSWTPSGGIHIVFTGEGKSSTNGEIGIDTRGLGGYFIAPPSRIYTGDYAGDYATSDDWGRNPGPIPAGLIERLFGEKTKSYQYIENKYATPDKKQLSRATLDFMVNGAKEGGRNATLFKVLADFSGCGYTEEEAKEIVFPVALRIGLPSDEIHHVLEQAYSKQRTPSIPESIQEKLAKGGKNIASKITYDEQSIMEDALLACLIKDNSLVPVIGDILNSEDFQVLKNRIIFKTIIRLNNNDIAIDLITVVNEINKTTDKIKLDDISRMLNEHFLSTDSVIAYSHIIKEKASIRKLEQMMDNKETYIKNGNFIEILNAVEKDLSNIAVYAGAKTTAILDSQQATEVFKKQILAVANGEILQLKTGFTDYDKNIGGIYPHELVVCAARTGEGKSALSLTLANEVGIRQKKGVAMFSLEMSTHETMCRLICQITGIPFKQVFQGKMNQKEWREFEEALEAINAGNIFFDDSFGITIPELRSKIRKIAEKDISLIIIDQLEQIRGYEGQPAHIRLDNLSYDIKNFTKEFGVPVILNHQLNRGITDRRIRKDNPEPELSDLNQAGEKGASQVWAITHRKDEEGEIIASKIKVLKNRNGPKMDFNVKFIGERMLFVNAAYEDWSKYEDKHFDAVDFEEHDDPEFVR